MKNFAIFILSIFIFIGCNDSSRPDTNANSAPRSPERSQSVTAHTTENQSPPLQNAPTSGAKTKWTQSGDPIDTKEFDAAIAKAEKNLKAKSSDEAAKKALAESYFKRGFALTEARQYASALGDYRRALKYDPNNNEAKDWIDKIIMIYGSINKEYPKEGEEPPPLPFKKI